MLKILVLSIALILYIAECKPATAVFPFSIKNISKINAQSSLQVIVGNEWGELQVYDRVRDTIKTNHLHEHRIIQIKEYIKDDRKQYVTVDESGLLIIWNSNMSYILHREQWFVNQSEIMVAVAVQYNRPKKYSQNKVNLLALTDGVKVFEYSLNQRSLKRILTKKYAYPFVSLSYIGKYLVSSIQHRGLFIAKDQSNSFEELYLSFSTIQMLSSHEEDGSLQNDGIGVQNKKTIIHFSKSGIWQRRIEMHQNSTIVGIKECKSNEKRQKEELIAVALSDGTILLRNFHLIYQKYSTNSEIIDIVCQEDDLIYADENSNIVLIELDHLMHSRSRVIGIASIFFAVFIVILVIYHVNKEKNGEDRLGGNVEMRTIINYEPPRV